jgi:hypothetical protein
VSIEQVCPLGDYLTISSGLLVFLWFNNLICLISGNPLNTPPVKVIDRQDPTDSKCAQLEYN